MIPYFFSKLSKAIITTVILSVVSFIRERRIRLIILCPHRSWMFLYLLRIFVRSWMDMIASLFETVSNIPSLAKIMKSWLGIISNWTISGTAETTFGRPPSSGTFASTSPKVRHTLKYSLTKKRKYQLTANLPGSTRSGPWMIYPISL